MVYVLNSFIFLHSLTDLGLQCVFLLAQPLQQLFLWGVCGLELGHQATHGGGGGGGGGGLRHYRLLTGLVAQYSAPHLLKELVHDVNFMISSSIPGLILRPPPFPLPTIILQT